MYQFASHITTVRINPVLSETSKQGAVDMANKEQKKEKGNKPKLTPKEKQAKKQRKLAAKQNK